MSFRLFSIALFLSSLLIHVTAADEAVIDTVNETAVENPANVAPVDTSGMSKHVIIAGTFQQKEKADAQLEKLQSVLQLNPEIVALKEAYGFDYVSRPSGKYFVVAIEPVYGQEALQKVLSATREIFSDAYEYVRPKTVVEEPTVIETVSEDVPVAAVVEEATESVVEPVAEKAEAVTAEPVAEPVSDEVPMPAAETLPVGVEEASEAVEEAAVLPEPETEAVVVPVAEPSVKAEEGTGVADLVVYGAVALLVLLLVLFMMRRGKREKEEAPETKAAAAEAAPVEEAAISEVAEEAVEIAEELPEEAAEERAEVEAAPEAIPEVEEVPEAVEEVVEEEITPIEEPVAEPEVEAEVAEEVPEAVEEEALPSEEAVAEPEAEEVVEAVPVAAEEGPKRKKREPKADRGKISKEDLAEFGGNRILVAEDNMINQKVLTSLMADSGIEIVIANDGQEAIDTLASDSNFQMILMDAHMPVKDGFEATREIRSNSAYDHIPIVALSGDVAADDLRKMEEAGMEEQLAKPIKLEELYDVMYCYFDIEVEEEEDEYADIDLLPDTDELHAEDGLEISGGDEELYREILQEFGQMYGKSDELLNNYLVHDDRTAANALLLDVHGIAANIGANQLADTADELREALLEGKEAKYTPLYESYCKHLHKVLSDIEKL